MHVVETNWVEGELFDAVFENHHVMIDNTIKGGGTNKGSQPKPLMLMALTGCIGLNLVPLLEKMRIPFSAINFHVEGDLNDGVPKVYTSVRVTITVNSNPDNKEKIDRAIQMTEEKYCGVSQMFRKFCELTVHVIVE